MSISRRLKKLEEAQAKSKSKGPECRCSRYDWNKLTPAQSTRVLEMFEEFEVPIEPYTCACHRCGGIARHDTSLATDRMTDLELCEMEELFALAEIDHETD